LQCNSPKIKWSNGTYIIVHIVHKAEVTILQVGSVDVAVRRADAVHHGHLSQRQRQCLPGAAIPQRRLAANHWQHRVIARRQDRVNQLLAIQTLAQCEGQAHGQLLRVEPHLGGAHTVVHQVLAHVVGCKHKNALLVLKVEFI
jgi:hypothetical protein